VAGAQQADLLVDLAAAMDRGIGEGRTLDDFRADFRAVIERRGWHGWTGEGTEAGERWRTRTIYQTNMDTSYAAGRRAQLDAGGFPIIVYRHSGLSKEPRPEHLAWDGLTYAPDSEFRRSHQPPNGYGCQCYEVGARSEAGARRLGGDPAKSLPPGWDQRDSKGRLPGVGEGWDYAPGATVSRQVQIAAAKAAGYPAPLNLHYMQSIPAGRRDALADAYRALPSVRRDTRLYAQRIQEGRTHLDIPPTHTLGLATAGQRQASAEALGSSVPELADWALDAATVAALGTAVPPALYSRLPALLRLPDAIDAARNRVQVRDGELVAEWLLRDGRLFLAALRAVTA
jgi:hypothetical protein